MYDDNQGPTDPTRATENLEASKDLIPPRITEPLLSEAEAAAFLGISKMTLLRNRNAGNLGFFRVGFRVLYSKEKHLIPFLIGCEKSLLIAGVK